MTVSIIRKNLCHKYSLDIYHHIDVTVELSNSSFTVSEDQGWVTVCVVLDGYIDRFVEVEIFTTDGTAKGA